MPAQVTAGGVFSVPKFEPVSATAKRAMAWFQHTGKLESPPWISFHLNLYCVLVPAHKY